MLIKRTSFDLRRAAIGMALLGLSSVFPTRADDDAQPKKAHLLFIQQDKVVTFDLTPPTASQPFGGGQGAQVGTATGAIKGTTVVNFKFTFTSIPTALPLTFDFDNRVGITDIDGDQIIFKNDGTGRFNPPLVDPTLGNPGVSPFQVFGNGVGGPLTGTYQVLATSGKFQALYPIGTVFPYRAISFNPASPPTPPGTPGSSYVEIFDGSDE